MENSAPARNIEMAKDALINKDKKKYEELLRDLIVYAEWTENRLAQWNELMGQIASAYYSNAPTSRTPVK